MNVVKNICSNHLTPGTIQEVKEIYAPKFVVIGGGTGSFTLLSGLKHYANDISALVNMADDGGSTGILRDELGVLPPGDIRQCLVALSDSPQLRELFNYRFPEGGGLRGHSFGNLFLSAVEKMTDKFEDAVELASELLRIQGKVIPVTTTKSQLILTQKDGSVVRGEYKIGHHNFLGNIKPVISLDPVAHLTKDGKDAIEAADVIVIAPGNLYGSLAPALVVDGVRQAIKKSKAKLVYVCNLVTKPNQTDGFKVHDYASEVERFIGAPLLDYVIYNTDEPPRTLLEKYIHEGEKLVEFDLERFEKCHYQAAGLPLIATDPIPQRQDDAIAKSRSLIRHDTDAVSRQLMRIYFE